MEDYSLLTFPLWILFPWLKISRISISRFSKLDVKCNWLRPKFRSSRQRSSRSILVILSPPLPKKDQASRRNSINNKTENETREESSILYAIRSTGPVIRSMFAETWIFYTSFFLKRAHTNDSSNSKKDTYTRDLLFSTVLDLRHFSLFIFFCLASIDFFLIFSFFFSFPPSLLNFSERTHSCRFDLTPVQSSPLIVLRV